jgi:hypothetical protein
MEGPDHPPCSVTSCITCLYGPPTHSLSWVARFAVILFLALVTCLAYGGRKKTDTVYMKNGDKITGELQSLSQGQLFIKPDYTTSSFILDWDKVDHIQSSQEFTIVDPNGVVYPGTISQGPMPDSLAVVNAKTITLPTASVIAIRELGETFWKRMNGNISLGLSVAKSNQQTNLAIQGGLGYQSTQHLFSANVNSQFATQQKVTNTAETNAKTAFYRQLRQSRWYAGGLANFLSSSEQKIAFQSSLGGGLGRLLIFTNRTNLYAVGGLVYTKQVNSSGTISTAPNNSLDAALSVEYSTFRFDAANFNTVVWVYPSLSSPGHFRMTLNQSIYYKLPKNFFVNFSFYDNYDNEPVVGAPQNNLGASTTVGWSFP